MNFAEFERVGSFYLRRDGKAVAATDGNLIGFVMGKKDDNYGGCGVVYEESLIPRIQSGERQVRTGFIPSDDYERRELNEYTTTTSGRNKGRLVFQEDVIKSFNRKGSLSECLNELFVEQCTEYAVNTLPNKVRSVYATFMLRHSPFLEAEREVLRRQAEAMTGIKVTTAIPKVTVRKAKFSTAITFTKYLPEGVEHQAFTGNYTLI